MLRLRNFETALANFYASGIFNLREKIGPFLWQFPPQFRYDEARFETFFAALPRTLAAALSVARRRDARMPMTGNGATGAMLTAKTAASPLLRTISLARSSLSPAMRRTVSLEHARPVA